MGAYDKDNFMRPESIEFHHKYGVTQLVWLVPIVISSSRKYFHPPDTFQMRSPYVLVRNELTGVAVLYNMS